MNHNDEEWKQYERFHGVKCHRSDERQGAGTLVYGRLAFGESEKEKSGAEGQFRMEVEEYFGPSRPLPRWKSNRASRRAPLSALTCRSTLMSKNQSWLFNGECEEK